MPKANEAVSEVAGRRPEADEPNPRSILEQLDQNIIALPRHEAKHILVCG